MRPRHQAPAHGRPEFPAGCPGEEPGGWSASNAKRIAASSSITPNICTFTTCRMNTRPALHRDGTAGRANAYGSELESKAWPKGSLESRAQDSPSPPPGHLAGSGGAGSCHFKCRWLERLTPGASSIATIKPANVFITKRETPRSSNFGLAKIHFTGRPCAVPPDDASNRSAGEDRRHPIHHRAPHLTHLWRQWEAALLSRTARGEQVDRPGPILLSLSGTDITSMATVGRLPLRIGVCAGVCRLEHSRKHSIPIHEADSWLEA